MRLQDPLIPVIRCEPSGRPPPAVASPNAQSPLMRLSAELRNRIYEYALTDDEEIEITADLKQPALLLTCREIRNDATKMWYFTNTFYACIRDCDARLLCAFHTHLMTKYGQNEEYHRIRVLNYIYDSPSWPNLMKWCHAVWEGKAHGPRPARGSDPAAGLGRTGNTVAAATEVVFWMRDGAKKGAYWFFCEQALKGLRAMAGAIDERWFED